MGQEASSSEITKPLKAAPHCNCRKHNGKKCIIVLGVALAVMFLALLAAPVLAVVLYRRPFDCGSSSAVPLLGSPVVPSPSSPVVLDCLDGWIGYRGKCYYFSEEEKNWDSSQHFCSVVNASLAIIDTQQEKDFMMRYGGLAEHWIGLRRESDLSWKWVNGTKFSQQLFQVRAEGDCAYLSDLSVSSSRCYTLRNWICSKPDAYTKGTENAVERAPSSIHLDKNVETAARMSALHFT